MIVPPPPPPPSLSSPPASPCQHIESSRLLPGLSECHVLSCQRLLTSSLGTKKHGLPQNAHTCPSQYPHVLQYTHAPVHTSYLFQYTLIYPQYPQTFTTHTSPVPKRITYYPQICPIPNTHPKYSHTYPQPYYPLPCLPLPPPPPLQGPQPHKRAVDGQSLCRKCLPLGISKWGLVWWRPPGCYFCIFSSFSPTTYVF